MAVFCVDDSPKRAEKPSQPTGEEMRAAAASFLKGRDFSTISIKELRRAIESQLSLADGALAPRKDEIKAIAVEFINAPPPAPVAKPLIPASKSAAKRSAPDPANTSDAVTGEKPAKKPRRISAYSLFSSERGAAVREELEKNLQRKPTLGEAMSKVSEVWNGLAAEEKKEFEEKAAKANADAPAQPTSGGSGGRGQGRSQGTQQGRGRGGGKGRGKSHASEEACMTRAEFLRNSMTLKCRIDGLSLFTEKEDEAVEVAKPFESQSSSRMFKSGSVGWFQGGKGVVEIDGKKVVVQVGLNITACGSKNWADGEGFDALKEQVAEEKTQGEDGEALGSSTGQASNDAPTGLAPNPADAPSNAQAEPIHDDASKATPPPAEEENAGSTDAQTMVTTSNDNSIEESTVPSLANASTCSDVVEKNETQVESNVASEGLSHSGA